MSQQPGSCECSSFHCLQCSTDVGGQVTECVFSKVAGGSAHLFLLEQKVGQLGGLSVDEPHARRRGVESKEKSVVCAPSASRLPLGSDVRCAGCPWGRGTPAEVATPQAVRLGRGKDVACSCVRRFPDMLTR
jgi:hypothetical protein